MAKVNVHFRFPTDKNWRHNTVELQRVPCVGEFVQVGGIEGNGCKVMMVVHHQESSDVWGEHIQDFKKLAEELIPWDI